MRLERATVRSAVPPFHSSDCSTWSPIELSPSHFSRELETFAKQGTEIEQEEFLDRLWRITFYYSVSHGINNDRHRTQSEKRVD